MTTHNLICPLCTEPLYLVYSMSMGLTREQTPVDRFNMGEQCDTSTWWVECAEGHKIETPVNDADDYAEPFDWRQATHCSDGVS